MAGKNNGLGDLEVLCAVSQMPIEIGNRVWLDVDHNGVQDPDEVPLAEIVVQLFTAAAGTVPH
ncbi:MAG: SdrD B-like domain-containing protein [Caldilineaceae bacterium]